jgi:sulfatase maturation enzyme AslB (radical SAM superfamily)
VSVDGLQPDHDERRKPATYERILRNIQGSQVTVHCTITGQMTRQENYFERFLAFWSARPEIRRIWMSIFTPQKGAVGPEILSPQERVRVIDSLGRLRAQFPKLDMSERVLREFRHPPKSPQECVFAKATQVISADLKTRVSPCQFGGNPDCSQCGCMASMGLAAVGHLQVGAGISLGKLYSVSERIGNGIGKLRNIQKEVA